MEIPTPHPLGNGVVFDSVARTFQQVGHWARYRIAGQKTENKIGTLTSRVLPGLVSALPHSHAYRETLSTDQYFGAIGRQPAIFLITKLHHMDVDGPAATGAAGETMRSGRMQPWGSKTTPAGRPIERSGDRHRSWGVIEPVSPTAHFSGHRYEVKAQLV